MLTDERSVKDSRSLMLNLLKFSQIPADSTCARGNRMRELVKRLWHEEEGANLSEYILLVVLISLVAVTAVARW